MHAVHHRCGGYTIHRTREDALAEANNAFYRPGSRPRVDKFPRDINQQVVVRAALDSVDKSRIVSTIQELQDLGTRYYQSSPGEAAAIALKKKWEVYGAGRSDFSVAFVPHSWRQSSVVATIKGAEMPDEIVVIGGHLDSINPRDNNSAPGADDDASGIAAVSEVLRVLLAINFRPKRTLQFIAYAAEEVGLRGSTEIARTYKDEGKQVISALQLDMTGYIGSPEHVYFITDYTNQDLNDFLKALVREYNGSGNHQITWGESMCGYACSDHASWTGTGVPAAFPFESRFSDYNRNIHSSSDTLSNIDTSGTQQSRFAKLGVEFMIEQGKAAGASPQPQPQPQKDRYLYTSLRIISSSANRGCGYGDWNCMTQLCKADLGTTAWRGWAGCYRDGDPYQCMFECGVVSRFFE
jgi:leucyl aminopeptidase